MSAVNVTNINVLDNPSPFLSPFKFEITYNCIDPLKEDLEWKLTYVGSADDETYDQQLEDVFVGPVNLGSYRFLLQADPPDPARIPAEDILGVTVLMLTSSYVDQEFLRIGYFVNNEYTDENLREQPPQTVLIDKIQRNILTDKPRVTKFLINFHPENSETGEQAPPPPDDNTAEAGGSEEQLPSPKIGSDVSGT
ncbi:putative histone chaperone ASF1A [Capsicum chinense]|uniref:Histone chaperone ASF1A n=1 Tax=Capsicum annuum TaxID=4072 RepID=A0A2G3A4J0_CAPAN|nr:histone chaperone ASF1B [Capsicum annuum]KAF3629083.1 putative histone chaperone ASF1A [Capsicum annuum]PHT89110.1 putative histone chaperone ASF1A [Capsicum annuum]PHU24842.1 putative histone chaperone ASF1A [Capsicum chinense]